MTTERRPNCCRDDGDGGRDQDDRQHRAQRPERIGGQEPGRNRRFVCRAPGTNGRTDSPISAMSGPLFGSVPPKVSSSPRPSPVTQ